MKVTVQTYANIPLIKYWGKRDEQRFLPTKSSLAVTLSALTSQTTIQRISDSIDHISTSWTQQTQESSTKIIQFINRLRKQFNINDRFAITTNNNFPTAAGFASSSSGFAALAAAFAHLCNLGLAERELSILARQGSGSASRSLSGGFVLWHKGIEPDGSDSYAEQIFDEHHWPELRILVVVIQSAAKPISSREGMRITVATSPSYQHWLIASAERLKAILPAIAEKNIELVGALAEDDWYDMHRSMLDSTPSLRYWDQTSYAVIDQVKRMRADGLNCFFTTDAGPNVKIFCLEHEAPIIEQRIKTEIGVQQVITCTVAGKPIISIKEQ
jgi:diphosphomevalonate decarboxylase